MTAYRRPFVMRPHDGGLHLVAGNRQIRLSADEVDELTAALAAPVIDREVARLTGVER